MRVRVRPNGRLSALEAREDGTWLATVKAPPVDGKANAELITLLARHFGVTKKQVTIRAGAGGRLKQVRIED